jgi:type IV pilus assembly protein PilC
MVTKVKKKAYRSGKKITDKDLTLFTRQLATMMKAGVPLLQSFDIVGKGHANPSMSKLIMDLRADIETGTSLNKAFRKYPLYFDPLFCNLVGAGEQAGILEDLLTRLAIYKEKTLAMKAKIKSALMYPVSILAIAFIVTAVIMIWVVPAFKEVFTSFGADLPAPDPGRDGDVRIFREVVVCHLRRPVRPPSTSSSRPGAARCKMQRHGPLLLRCPSSAT